MSRQYLIKYFSPLILLLASVSCSCVPKQTTMNITSVEPMQVWLDHELLGNAPYTFSVANDQRHLLEAKSGQKTYFAYEFERSSMPTAIDLPAQSQVNWQAYYPNNEVTADGKWAIEREPDFSTYLVNNSNPNERRLILTPEAGVGARISPDGRFMIYIDADHNAIWIAPVDEPKKRVRVFDQYVACMKEEIYWPRSPLDMGFSPDSRWVWFRGNCAFAVASIDQPQETVLAYESGVFFMWSQDSQWVAFSEASYENDILWIYHVVNGQFQLFSNDLEGLPRGFSENGRYIWTWDQYESNGRLTYEPVRLIDLQSHEVLFESKTKQPIRVVIGSIVQSPDGKLYAFLYRLGESNLDNIMVVSADGKHTTTFSDQDYSTVVSWLPDSHYLLVENAQFILTLLEVPDDFQQ